MACLGSGPCAVRDVGLDEVAVLFHPLAALLGVLARHQHVEELAIGLQLAVLDPHREQAAGVGIERRLPQLFRVHLAEALEALHCQTDSRFTPSSRARRRSTSAPPRRARRASSPAALAVRGNVDLVERRAARCRCGRSRSASGSDGRTASAAAPDMRPVHVGVGQRGDLAVAQAREVGVVLVACGDRRRSRPRCRGSRRWRTACPRFTSHEFSALPRMR